MYFVTGMEAVLLATLLCDAVGTATPELVAREPRLVGTTAFESMEPIWLVVIGSGEARETRLAVIFWVIIGDPVPPDNSEEGETVVDGDPAATTNL